MRLPRLDFLDRERTVAPPGFNRWLIPPAALAVHLCIGEVYGFSVFNVPLTRVLGVTQSITGRTGRSRRSAGSTRSRLIMLGLSAAVLGPLGRARRAAEDHVRQRRAASAAACCCRSLGVALHSIWAALPRLRRASAASASGLGYISPVSTLVKWFPDRPGMATGLAIMGFGGGALIGAPLGVELMGALPVGHLGRGEGSVPRDGRASTSPS